MAFALGVAFAALLLDMFSLINGTEVGVREMQLAFFILAAITAMAMIPILVYPNRWVTMWPGIRPK